MKAVSWFGLLLGTCVLTISIGTGLSLAEDPDIEPDTDESQESAEPSKEDDELKDTPVFTEDVTVTATRVETSLMKTPIAVTVLDQETLDREGVQDLTDIAQMVPNMDIATKNGQSTPIISLRGVRSTNETELGDPAVGVHLDGIYSPRMQGILGLMFDNERVEILRGPQGTLFGRNSTVGSINIVSAKPKLDRVESKVNVQYGNYNAPELQMMFNKPLTETFGVRFAGRFHESESYIDGYWDPNQYDQRNISGKVADAAIIAPGSFEACTSPQCLTRTQHSNWWADDLNVPIRELVPADSDNFYGNSKEWAYRLSALWQPEFKDMSLNLSFQHYQNKSAGGLDLVNCEKLRGRPTYLLEVGDENGDGLFNQLILDDQGKPIVTGTNDCGDFFPKDDTYQAVVNQPGELMLEIMYLRARFSWDIKENLRLVNSLGLEDQDRESIQDMDQSLNAWDQSLIFLPGTGSQSWSNEIQLQSFGNQRFNWIAGANYFYEKTNTLGFFDNAIDEKALFDQPDRSTTASAFFAQGTYTYSPKWHMTIGGRFSDETKEDQGGRTFICNVANGCASDDIAPTQVNAGTIGFDRDDLNSLPADYFYSPSVYTDSQGTPVFSANDNKGSWNHTDWRVGLDYQKNDNTLLYSYIATGFKAGGIGDVFEGTVVDGDIDKFGDPFVVSAETQIIRTSYEPEEVTTLELGFKQRLWGGKLLLKGAYFFSDYENMQYASVGSVAFTEKYRQLTDSNGNPFDADGDGNFDFGWVGEPLFTAYFTQNVPGAEIHGLELEYEWRAWRGGKIRGYASTLNAEITENWNTKWDYDPRSYFALGFSESVDATNEALQVNLKGNDLAVSPPVKIHMTVDHAFFFEKRQMTIVPWVTAHWEADSYLTIWNVDKHNDDLDFVILDQDLKYTDDKRDAWSMYHAGISLYSGDFKAEIYGYNITDEVVQWWGGAAEQVAKGSFSMPITYGIRMGYNF